LRSATGSSMVFSKSCIVVRFQGSTAVCDRLYF
jgi:hypothetical protein